MNNDTLQGRDIVVVGLQPWDVEIGSNCKDIAREFSRDNRVLYVNYPLDRRTLYQNSKDPKIIKRLNVIRKKEPGIVPIGDNFWNLYTDEIAESANWISSYSIFDYVNKINNKRFARSIRKALVNLGFKNIILFNDNDFMRSFYLKELLRPDISIFYYRDFLLGVDYWRRHGVKLEPLILAKSDLCLTNSIYFKNYCLEYNPNSFYVGQGCDLSMFQDQKEFETPEDIAVLAGPKIGYVGALQNIRLDLQLLEHIAKEKPAWNIILVGPEDDVFKASSLHQVKNIHFLGSKDVKALPAYINAFDVCLNPQLINEITIGNYPRKIDEYLAMGKPVVATKTELMATIFGEHTYTGVTKNDYVELIEKALQEDNLAEQQRRKAFAATHSWENNVKEIYKAINLLKTKH